MTANAVAHQDLENLVLGVIAEYFATFPDSCSVEGENAEMWIEAATGWEVVALRPLAGQIATEILQHQGNS
ncbi:hypothetical protein ACQPW1_09935 [Nocardia sp. CA-128927]|uniref:hypothetical protein n=1 Tax=Nocardia sp. CA-128927 TaxID=3239975 RepID=UPI003D98B635